MRRFFWVLSAVGLLGCSEAENETPEIAADSAGASVGISLADVAGTWYVSVLAENGDSVLTTYSLLADADSTWSLVFAGRTDTIPVHVVGVGGDSILTQAGPFPSDLRENVSVSSRAVERLQGGLLVGRLRASYQPAGADSVVIFRTEGMRGN